MSVLTHEQSVLNRYKMNVPEMLQYPADKNIRVVQVCPSTAEIMTVGVKQAGTSDFQFETSFSKEQFLSTAIKVNYSIPFKIKLAAWPAGGVTKDNFITSVFAKSDNLTLAQMGIVQGITTQELRFNDSPLPIISDIGEMCNITSQYWDRDSVMSEIQGSVPDRFIDVSSYSSVDGVEFIDNWGEKSRSYISPDNDDPFAGKLPIGYNSRTPIWRFVDEDQTSLTVKVVATFWNFLNFSVGTLVQNEIALAGIHKLNLKIRTDPDLANKIFIKKNNVITSITQDLADKDNTKAQMVIRLLSAPSYIVNNMQDKNTGLLKPYSISMPLFEHSRYNSYLCKAKETKTFSHDGHNLSSIPRSIIIALNRDRVDSKSVANGGDGLKILDKPIAFGLISQLKIKINSTITEFPDIHAMIAAAMTSGYQELDQLGMLTKGFALRIPCDTLLSLPGDSAVGKAGNYTLSVSGSFYNQSTSDETFTLTVTVVNEAELQFSGERFALAAGVLIPPELFDDKNFLTALYSENMVRLGVLGGMAGAGFFGDAGRWIKKNGVNLVKTLWNNREAIGSAVGDVVGLVKTLKGGEDGGQRSYSNTSGAGKGLTALGAGTVKKNVYK